MTSFIICDEKLDQLGTGCSALDQRTATENRPALFLKGYHRDTIFLTLRILKAALSASCALPFRLQSERGTGHHRTCNFDQIVIKVAKRGTPHPIEAARGFGNDGLSQVE